LEREGVDRIKANGFMKIFRYQHTIFKRDSTTGRIITSVEFFEFSMLESRFDELVKHKEEILFEVKWKELSYNDAKSIILKLIEKSKNRKKEVWNSSQKILNKKDYVKKVFFLCYYANFAQCFPFFPL